MYDKCDSLPDFDSEKASTIKNAEAIKEEEAIEEARKQAVIKKYLKNENGTLEKIGSGSGGRNSVFKVPCFEITDDFQAVKIIPYITKEIDAADWMELALMKYKKSLISEEEKKKNNPAQEEISNFLEATKSCRNVIPLKGFDFLIWECGEYSKIGLDYVLKMPVAECLDEKMKKFHYKKMEDKEVEELVIQIGIDLCTALEDLHNRKIIHRDIKPANIYWYKNQYCLGDFGISTENRNVQNWEVGTRDYWSPEQADPLFHNEFDGRMDIYSLGLVLYELVDRQPMHVHYDQRIGKKYLPELKRCSEGLNRILQKACQFYPEERFQTAADFKRELERIKENPKYIYEEDKILSKSDANTTLQRSKVVQSPFKRPDKKDQKNSVKMKKELTPETLWNAGKFWYEESLKKGSRFGEFHIDEKIMPLSVECEKGNTDLPINICKENDKDSKNLGEYISRIEEIHNMYLIGEGGMGKTTALYSIMKKVYEKNHYIKNKKRTIIPVFIELSKAPVRYVKAYESFRSTFIRRYMYFLIMTRNEQYNNAEIEKMFCNIMETDDQEAAEKIDELLMNQSRDVQYLLLLDGLNEVSQKQLIKDASGDSGSAEEMIIEEIQRLSKYENVKMIITSRADEIPEIEDALEKYYLIGLKNKVIKEYLESNHVAVKGKLEDNERLINTLKNPFFLKMYCKLYSTEGISMPGEVLHAFFSERSGKYSVRQRIKEISKDQHTFQAPHTRNFITEKMQWFILDFLLPAIGWHMVKHEYYFLDRNSVKAIWDRILKSEEDADICGKYGRKFFDIYHGEKGRTFNIKSCADQILALGVDGNYTQEIIDYCVYSLGVLGVKDESVCFIHQHIRDYFASMKIITDMKLSVYVSEESSEKGIGCLKVINEDLINTDTLHLCGEILGEYRNCQSTGGSLIEQTLKLYRKRFEPEQYVGYGVHNLLAMIYESRKSLADVDLSYLDLRKCRFYNVELKRADMTGALINHDNLFQDNNHGQILKTAFSANGEFVYIGREDGTVSLWHRKTLSYIKNIKKCLFRIVNLSVTEQYIAISTEGGTEILDTENYHLIKKVGAYNAVFSPDGKYIALAFRWKRVQVCDTKNFTCQCKLDCIENPEMWVRGIDLMVFSPDSKYIALAAGSNRGAKKYLLDQFTGDSLEDEFRIKIWSIELKKCIAISKETYFISNKISNIDFSSDGRKILVNKVHDEEIEIYSFDAERREIKRMDSIDVSKESKEKIKGIRKAKFTDHDSCIVAGTENGEVVFIDYKKFMKERKNYYYKTNEHIWRITDISKWEDENHFYVITSSLVHSARLWDIKKRKCEGSFTNMRLSGYVFAVYIEDGKYVVTSGQGNHILLWDTMTGKCVDSIGDFQYNTWIIAYNKKKKQIAVSLLDGSVVLYDFDDTEHIFRYVKKVKMQDDYIDTLEYDLEGNHILAASLRQPLVVYDINKEKVSYIFNKEADFCGSATFADPFGEKIWAGTFWGGLTLFETSSSKKIREIDKTGMPECELHRMTKRKIKNYDQENYSYKNVKSIYVDWKNNFLYVYKWGDFFEVWDLKHEKCSAIIEMDESCVRANRIAVNTDGKYIAFGSATPWLNIYETGKDWGCKYRIIKNKRNLQKMRRIQKFHQKSDRYENEVLSVEFSPDNKGMLTSSCDGTVKLWKFPEKENENILEESKILKCIPGLKTQGIIFKDIHPKSDISDEDIECIKMYGGITE